MSLKKPLVVLAMTMLALTWMGEAFGLAGCGKSSSSTSTSTTKTLKELATDRGIRFGAFYQYDIRSDAYDTVFAREMNAMTVGSFWTDTSRPSRTQFDLTELDFKVNWGRERSMELYGQTLVWFEDIPDWVKETPLAEVETVMNEHIDTVVARYAGKIAFWNVVNEAIDPDGNIRLNHRWAEAMGADYISKAFVRARAADANAVLYYNEFDIEKNVAKYNGTKALLTTLLNAGVPVQALGWQMHLSPGSFDPTTLLTRLNEIADLGLDNYITELDVELPENASTSDYDQQQQTYKSVIETFLQARRHKTIITWGIRDNDPGWLTTNHPLPFDENLNAKSAYTGIQQALLGQ